MRRRKKYTPQNRVLLLNNPFAPRLCPELAKEIGLNESIILLQMEYWIATEGEEHGGYDWVRRSVRELTDTFDYLSTGSAHRTLERLEKKGFLVTDQFDCKPGKGAKWYRLNLDQLKTLKSIGVCSKMEQVPNDGCSTGEVLNTQNGTTVLISKEQDQIHSVIDDLKTENLEPQKPPRAPSSDEELDDVEEKYSLTTLLDSHNWNSSARRLHNSQFERLPWEKFYKKWVDTKEQAGGLKIRGGGRVVKRATFRQWIKDLEMFFETCWENLQKNPNTQDRPYTGPGIETEEAKQKRESYADCEKCGGTGSYRFRAKDARGVERWFAETCDHDLTNLKGTN